MTVLDVLNNANKENIIKILKENYENSVFLPDDTKLESIVSQFLKAVKSVPPSYKFKNYAVFGLDLYTSMPEMDNDFNFENLPKKFKIFLIDKTEFNEEDSNAFLPAYSLFSMPLIDILGIDVLCEENNLDKMAAELVVAMVFLKNDTPAETTNIIKEIQSYLAIPDEEYDFVPFDEDEEADDEEIDVFLNEVDELEAFMDAMNKISDKNDELKTEFLKKML